MAFVIVSLLLVPNPKKDGLQTDPMLCDRFTMALGMVLNMSSFLALLLLNAIYVIYRSPVLYHRVFIEYLHDHLPRLQLDQQALYYNVTLMCFYLLFAAFSDQQHVGGSSVVCRVVAMLNYWLLMCCILLTIFQAGNPSFLTLLLGLRLCFGIDEAY